MVRPSLGPNQIVMVRSGYSGLLVSGAVALGTLGIGAIAYRYPHAFKRLAATFKPRANPRVVHAATKGKISAVLTAA